MNEQIDEADSAVNHYETLGIAETATPEEIRMAYRRAVKICHPDHNHNDPRAAKLFRELTSAYKILRDPEQRHTFDSSLGLGTGYRPWYSSESAKGPASAPDIDPKLKPYIDKAKQLAETDRSAADIAAALIEDECTYEAAWDLAWQARHDQMARRMQYPEAASTKATIATNDGLWQPHRDTLWEKLRSGVSRIFS